ncbi:hypothetical protein E4U25_007154 [Claviceps purpurea]|nr:hypothetical protein E4U25_007154 [Claviceps purpurea]
MSTSAAPLLQDIYNHKYVTTEYNFNNTIPPQHKIQDQFNCDYNLQKESFCNNYNLRASPPPASGTVAATPQHSHITTPPQIRNPERDKRTSEWVEKQGPEMFEPETSEEVESGKNGSEKDESKILEGLKWKFQGSEKSTAVLQATTQHYAF